MIRVLLADGRKLVRSGLRAVLAGQRDLHVVGEASSGAQLLRAVKELAPDAIVIAAAAGCLVVTAAEAERFVAREEPARGGGRAAALTKRELDVLRLLARGLTNTEIADELALGKTTVKSHVRHLLAKLGLRDRLQAAIYAHERREDPTGANATGVPSSRAIGRRIRAMSLLGAERDWVDQALKAGAGAFLTTDVTPERLAAAIRRVAAGYEVLNPTVGTAAGSRPTSYPESWEHRLSELTGREREVLWLVVRGCSTAEIGEALALGESTVKFHIKHALAKLRLPDRVSAVVHAYELGLVGPKR